MTKLSSLLILFVNILMTRTASLEEAGNATVEREKMNKTSSAPNISLTLPTEMIRTEPTVATTKMTHANDSRPHGKIHPVKPFQGSHTFLFVSIFALGFIGVLVFYVYKKSSGSLSDSRYQYSVLNSNNMLDPDEDSDPLLTDLGRNDEDDNNFLDITRYRYSDDEDVELLGTGAGDFLCDVVPHAPVTVASQAQVNTELATNNCKNNLSSSAILNDSDEELLQ